MRQLTKISFCLLPFLFGACMATMSSPGTIKLIPAEELSKSVREGSVEQFSMYEQARNFQNKQNRARLKQAEDPQITQVQLQQQKGDPRFLKEGLMLKRSFGEPLPTFINDGDVAPGNAPRPPGQHPHLPPLPPGSSAPYHSGQMTANPSLWPDEAQGAFLFRDFRAFQAMDVVTILVNETSEGTKKSETDTKREFNLLAGITEFFGIETSKWTANNTSLDPTQLVKADTSSEFKGEGETTREGTLRATMSALVMEVLPNGLLRIEGTKIISLNNEEEIMVVSGLTRPEDVDSRNQVSSSKIANMRIDFYGRGLITESQAPGWAARLFHYVWPF